MSRLRPGQPARAEHAAHGAADLGRDADGLAGVVEADAVLGGPDDDRLDQRSVPPLEEQLVRHIGRLAVEDELGGNQGDVASSQARELLGQFMSSRSGRAS